MLRVLKGVGPVLLGASGGLLKNLLSNRERVLNVNYGVYVLLKEVSSS